MRLFISLIMLVVFAGCPSISDVRPPPPDRFFWPSGMAFVPAGGPQGTLFVVNANFNKRFTTGSLSALDLSTAALPAFGSVPDGGAVAVTVLPSMPTALISSFGGEIAALKTSTNRWRLYVPSRSEGMKFQAIDADFSSGSLAMTCATSDGGALTDCGAAAPSLSPVEVERSTDGLPRAPAPFGVTLRTTACVVANDCEAVKPGLSCASGLCVRDSGFPEAQVLVTHLTQADSPPLSGTNTHGYLVNLDAERPVIDNTSYVDLGAGATNSVVSGARFAFVSGRFLYSGSNAVATNLVRVVDRSNAVSSPLIQETVAIADSRGIALSTDEKRAYLLGRSPDTLVVLGIEPGDRGTQIQVVRTVALPQGPSEVRVISRAGRSDLVVITCTGAGSLVFYDDDAGNVVAQVPGVGKQPFDVAVDRNHGVGARLFVSNFDDGRVAVVDVPDITSPQSARIVAQLGQSQLCLVKINDPGCPQ